MNLHEFQAKHIFQQYGIPIPRGFVARTADEARQAAEKLGGSIWVVKAQVHAGGRDLRLAIPAERDPEATGERVRVPKAHVVARTGIAGADVAHARDQRERRLGARHFASRLTSLGRRLAVVRGLVRMRR